MSMARIAVLAIVFLTHLSPFQSSAEDARAHQLYERANQERNTAVYRSLANINAALKIDPKNGQYNLFKACLLHDMEEDEEALPNINLAVEKLPGDPCALAHRGLVLAAVGRPAEGLVDAQKAVRLGQKTVTPQQLSIYHQFCGTILEHMKRWKEAERELDLSVQLSPTDRIARARRMNVGVVNKNWAHVIEDSSFLINIDSAGKKNYDSYVIRGDTYLQLKNYANAISDYKRAEAVNPDQRPAHQKLLNLYRLLHNESAAASEQKILQSLDDDIRPL